MGFIPPTKMAFFPKRPDVFPFEPTKNRAAEYSPNGMKRIPQQPRIPILFEVPSSNPSFGDQHNFVG